jgi:polyisoprenoid-binding protein YceI
VLGKQAIPAPIQAMLGGAQEVASFKTTTALDRGEYGVGVGSWAATTVVGSDVEIEILLEAHRM